MAGQAILGDTVLKSALAMEAATPTVEALVADHSRMVFRISYSILRNHHDAEDAAQEMLSPGMEPFYLPRRCSSEETSSAKSESSCSSGVKQFMSARISIRPSRVERTLAN
jgi:hypothetical protein